MHKFILLLGTGVATFFIGILPSLFSGQPNRNETRSCQVKQVRFDGRIVWTPCDEWSPRSKK